MRVAVTGLGTINCLGNDCISFWRNLIEGKCGITEVSSMDLRELGLNLAGEVKDFNPCDYGIDEKLDRTTQLSLCGALQAVKDANLDIEQEDRTRIGVSVGTSIGGYMQIEGYCRAMKAGETFEAERIMQMPSAEIAGFIAKQFHTQGPNMTTVTACAAGGNSIACGMDLIRGGMCDVVLAGGGDALTFMSQTGFQLLRALSKELCRPFNRRKTGILIGEGSAFMVLESLEHALSRGAKIYAELSGYGLSDDAYHPTTPDPNGGGAIRSMNWALDDAGIGSEDIDYINAHGTGTKFNDEMEIKAVKEVFGDRARDIPISSMKGAIGHTLGLAGSIEALATVLAIHNGVLIPTVLMEEPMNEDLDFVPLKARKADIRYAISNSFAFAGNTVSLVIKKYEKQ